MPRATSFISSSTIAAIAAVVIGVIESASAGGPPDPQWTVTNLHSPPDAYESFAYGVSGGAGGAGGGSQQVGNILTDVRRASLWSGTADSWVDLNPAGASFSGALGIASGPGGIQQVGYAFVAGKHHASLWSGSAASWVDLNPASATESHAYAVGGGQQVGKVILVGGCTHASLWSGSAESWVSLNPPFGTCYSIALGVSDGQQVGWVNHGGSEFASLWSGSAESWVSLHPAEAIYVSHAFGVCSFEEGGGQQVGRAFVADAVMGASFHAGLWSGSAESWVDLHPAGATWSEAVGVCCVGGVAQQVGKAVVNGKDHASLWCGTAESWVDLHAFVPAGFDSSVATSIWSDANFIYVAGYAHNTQNGEGFDEALLWTQAILPGGGPCIADVTGNKMVDVDDLLAVINDWGSQGPNIVADINDDQIVDVDDLLAVINGWGPCA